MKNLFKCMFILVLMAKTNAPCVKFIFYGENHKTIIQKIYDYLSYAREKAKKFNLDGVFITEHVFGTSLEEFCVTMIFTIKNRELSLEEYINLVHILNKATFISKLLKDNQGIEEYINYLIPYQGVFYVKRRDTLLLFFTQPPCQRHYVDISCAKVA